MKFLIYGKECVAIETCARFDLNCLFQLPKPVSARNIEIKIYQNIFRNLTSSIKLEIFALLFQRRIFRKPPILTRNSLNNVQLWRLHRSLRPHLEFPCMLAKQIFLRGLFLRKDTIFLMYI